jgi:hypothetical protein
MMNEARKRNVETGPRVMLRLADALSPKGEWCGPYAFDGAATWVYVGKTGYKPDFNPMQPFGPRLVERRPAATTEI